MRLDIDTPSSANEHKFKPASVLNPNLGTDNWREARKIIASRLVQPIARVPGGATVPYDPIVRYLLGIRRLDILAKAAKFLIDKVKLDVHFITKVLESGHEREYMYNLVYDRGLFPGFQLRAYVTRLVADFLNRLPFGLQTHPATLTFEQLHKITVLSSS